MNLGTIRKALTPALLGLVAVVVQWIVTGGLDEAELRTAVGALVMAVAVYFVPNDPAAATPTDAEIVTRRAR